MCHLCATQGLIEEAIDNLAEAEVLIGDYWLRPETQVAMSAIRQSMLALQAADIELENLTGPDHPPYKAGQPLAASAGRGGE